MFKRQIKKIINKILSVFNLRVVKLDADSMIDLTINDNNILSTQYFVGLKKNIVNIEIDKGRTDRWFDMSSKSLDPAIFAIRNALKKDLKGDSFYKNILSTLQTHKSLTSYKNAAKYLDIDFNDEKNLKSYPWWASVYPWDNRTFDDQLKLYPDEVKKNRLINGMKILFDNPDEIMKDDLENSLFSHAKQYAELTEEIKNNGFKYDVNYNHITAEIFVHNDKFCWKVGRDGNHRIAVLVALGFERIPVQITKIIRLDESKYWPNVKLGYFNETQAVNIFYNIFDAKPSKIHDKWIKKFVE